MFCVQCGHTRQVEDKFCANCGAPPSATAPRVPQALPLSQAAPAAYAAAAPAMARVPVVQIPELEKQTRQTALFLHLSQLAGLIIPFAGHIAPLVIWQIKKDELPLIDVHGKNVMNWIISEIIYAFVCVILCFLVVGLLLVVPLLVIAIVFPIVGAIKANNGQVWKYPLAITFLK